MWPRHWMGFTVGTWAGAHEVPAGRGPRRTRGGPARAAVMRVFMTVDTVGGVWTYALELARALRPHGVEIALASMGVPLTAVQRAELAAVPDVELFESTYRLEWMDEPWDDIAVAGEWLLSLQEELRPDVVHLNGYAHGALPWRAPVLVVGHSCVLSWWAAVKGERAPARWDRYRSTVALGLAGADLVVTPTRAILTALEEHYGPLPRSRVVPNGRDPTLFTPREKEPLVLAAGRLWDEAKNVAALGAIAPRLSWPVYVAGADQHPTGGTAALGGVHALGQLAPAEMAVWLARASIYALPARYEPFGLSALEAALAGCVLVLGDIPSLREVWEDTALFVPPADGEALVAAIEGLIADPGRRASLAACARRRASTYTSERMAAGYLEAYRVIREQGAGSREQNLLPHPSSLLPVP